MEDSRKSVPRIDRKVITLIYSVATLVLVGIVTLLGPIPDTVQLAIVSLLVIIFGLPHGALDAELAASLRLTKNKRSGVIFFTSYLLLTIGGVALWLWLPTAALLLFLILSAYHFSDDWLATLGRPASLILGSVVLGLPALSHPDLVARVFYWLLLPSAHAAAMATMLRITAGAGLLMLAIALVWKRRFDRALMVETGILIASSIILSPLFYFVMYFCLIHAQRHMLDCTRFLNLTWARCYYKSLPVVILTLIPAGTGYFFFASGDISHDLARWLFIGLFALTIPHMVLIIYWHRCPDSHRI